MARPKEFDQERALHRAISIFSQKGFAATSTDDLMRAMDVGRQSMYDTFGDKRALCLKALEVVGDASRDSTGGGPSRRTVVYSLFFATQGRPRRFCPQEH